MGTVDSRYHQLLAEHADDYGDGAADAAFRERKENKNKKDLEIGDIGYDAKSKMSMSKSLRIPLRPAITIRLAPNTSIFSALPFEILAKILAGLELTPATFLSLRLTCRDLAHILNPTEPSEISSEMARNSFPFVYAAFELPGGHPHRALCGLYDIHSTALQIITCVKKYMTPDDAKRESEDWEDMLYKCLVLWERFTYVCTQNCLDSFSWNRALHLSGCFSLDTHVLFRYVCARVSFCLYTIGVDHARDPEYVKKKLTGLRWHFLDDQYLHIAAGLVQSHSTLSDMLKIIQAPLVDETEFQEKHQKTFEYFSTFSMFLDERNEHFCRFIKARNPFPVNEGLNNLMLFQGVRTQAEFGQMLTEVRPTKTSMSPKSWLCDWNSSLYPEKDRSLRYHTEQRLLNRMLDQGNFNINTGVMKFARIHAGARCFRGEWTRNYMLWAWKWAELAEEDDALMIDVAFHLLQQCNFDDVLYSDLRTGNGILRQSIGCIDGAYKAAIRDLNMFDEKLKARAILGPKYYGRFPGYRRPVMEEGYIA